MLADKGGALVSPTLKPMTPAEPQPTSKEDQRTMKRTEKAPTPRQLQALSRAGITALPTTRQEAQQLLLRCYAPTSPRGTRGRRAAKRRLKSGALLAGEVRAAYAPPTHVAQRRANALGRGTGELAPARLQPTPAASPLPSLVPSPKPKGAAMKQAREAEL